MVQANKNFQGEVLTNKIHPIKCSWLLAENSCHGNYICVRLLAQKNKTDRGSVLHKNTTNYKRTKELTLHDNSRKKYWFDILQIISQGTRKETIYSSAHSDHNHLAHKTLLLPQTSFPACFLIPKIWSIYCVPHARSSIFGEWFWTKHQETKNKKRTIFFCHTPHPVGICESPLLPKQGFDRNRLLSVRVWDVCFGHLIRLATLDMIEHGHLWDTKVQTEIRLSRSAGCEVLCSSTGSGHCAQLRNCRCKWIISKTWFHDSSSTGFLSDPRKSSCSHEMLTRIPSTSGAIFRCYMQTSSLKGTLEKAAFINCTEVKLKIALKRHHPEPVWKTTSRRTASISGDVL